MIGMNPSNCHQPLFPVSCSLLAATAHVGNKMPRVQRFPSKSELFAGANVTSMNPSTKAMITLNSVNIQYSIRCARPLKTAYFLRTWMYHFISASFSWRCFMSCASTARSLFLVSIKDGGWRCRGLFNQRTIKYEILSWSGMRSL